MANVMFKKGLLANLPATHAEGTFYVTIDERAIYLDVSDSARIRLGDFQEFATLEALKANVNPSTSALYYISGLNVLAKWNGTDYIQINLDTGATSVEVVGNGNAVTAASYDAATRKLTLTMGESFATRAYVGEIPADKGETIVEYINKKAEETLSAAQGGSSETAASVAQALQNYKDLTDPRLEALEKVDHEHANAEELAKIASGDKEKWDAAAGKAHEHENASVLNGITAEKVAEWDAKQAAGDYATKAEAQGYADAKDEAIAAAKKSGDDAMAEAQKKVASVAAGDGSVTVAGTSTAPTVAVKLDPAADNAIKLGENGLKVEIGAAPEYSIVKSENSGDFAAIYNLTKDGTVVGASINIPKDMVVESGSVVENPEGQPEGTYIKLVLQNVAEPLFINVGSLIEYVTSGSVSGDMVMINVSDDHKVTATITDGTITLAKLTTEIQTAIGKAHSHENADVLAGISADKVAAWDAAEQNAKDHADDLDEAMDARMLVVEGKAHEHANKELLDTYTQTEANLADAVAKKHEHANKVELDKIVEGDKAKWDAAEQNAKDYADGLADNYDAAGAAAQALADAKAYADTAESDAVATANAYTDAALTWGSF